MGWIVGTAFWGFTLAMIFGGPLVDVIGIVRIISIAFVCHVIGIIMTIMVYFFNKLGIADWRFSMGAMLIPTLWYGIWFLNKEFPKTERVVSGFTYKEILKSCVIPLFIFIASCMILTAATELGTNQWIAALMANVTDSPILLLVWISGIMALARQTGGAMIHNMKSTVVLLTSAILAFAGLLLLGNTSGAMVFVAAAVFALGVAFFLPSMLGFVSENIPQSGAMGLAIMGGTGFLGGAIAQPALEQYSMHKPGLQYRLIKRWKVSKQPCPELLKPGVGTGTAYFRSAYTLVCCYCAGCINFSFCLFIHL